MNKPNLIVRLQNYNRVSLGAILGSCPQNLLDRFNVIVWKFDHPRPSEALNERSLMTYSFMLPHFQQVQNEVNSLLTEYGENRQFEIIAGGAQATCAPDLVASVGFDYVVSGEGEDFFPKFLEQWLEGKAVRGITETPRGKVNLDLHPGFSEITEYLPPIEISRGCRFGCMFCGVPRLNAGTLRHRSLESIESIVKEYYRISPRRRNVKFLASNAFAYGSDGLKPNLEAIRALLDMLKNYGVSKVNMGSFPSEVRPDFVTREIMELVTPYLANKTIVMGVQTGSDRMLKKMNRGHTCADSVRAMALLREYGFQPHVDFIVGNPGETENDQLELLDFMNEMVEKYQVRIHMHAFVPLPATPWAHENQSFISERIKQGLHALQKRGVLDGWWENHIGYFRASKAVEESVNQE